MLLLLDGRQQLLSWLELRGTKMDTEAKEIMDQVSEMFENCLLMLSSSMLTSAIVSTAVLPVFVQLKNYFLYSVNMPEAVL